MSGVWHKEDWPLDRLRRLVTAWNHGVEVNDLRERFGIDHPSLMSRLKMAKNLGLKVIERQRRERRA